MDAPAAYPSSNKAKRDWNQVDKNMQDELNKEKPEKIEFNDFLKQQYADADEDTRRAMMKSFQTSGDLDFNWDTVKKTDFERQNKVDSERGQRRQFGELRNGAKRAAVPRGRRRSAAPVVGHHGHSTAPSR